MRFNKLPVVLISSLIAVRAFAASQCSDPCTVDNSVDAATAFGEESDINAETANADLQSINGAAILDNDDDDDDDPPNRRRSLQPRQNSTSLCCSADESCLSNQGVAFCFNQATTEFRFGNGFYGFAANSSYYSSNGSLIDPNTGATLSNGGSTGLPARASATIPAASGPSSSMTEASATKSSGLESQSTLKAATSKKVASGTSTGSGPVKTATAAGQASSTGVGIGKIAATAALVVLLTAVMAQRTL